MDELLRKALERQKALREELEILDHFIRSYTQTRERAPDTRAQGDLFTAAPNRQSRALKSAQTAAQMDQAERLILEVGRPLTRSELLRGLEESGHSVEGGDKSKVLGTNLWRSKRFYNIKGVGYWPVSTPIPLKLKQQVRPSMLRDEN